MAEFDDPFKPSESTVIRPRPGAGRRAPSDPQPARHQPSVPVQQAEPLSAESLDAIGLGLGPLVRAASPLLLLAGQLRGTVSGPEVSTLRRHAMDEIRRFEDKARASGVQNETVLAARYALCAALDEAVLSTPWGAQSEWTQQSLLVALHREAYGGEKFFDMLDRITGDPKHHIELMEVQYLCLAMGFAGKYRVASRGQSQLTDIQHDLYRRIYEYRGKVPAELSPRWRGIQDKRNPLIRYVPWWVVGVAVFAVVAITFAILSSWLGPERNRVRTVLTAMQTAEPSARPPGRGFADYLTDDRYMKIVDGGAGLVLSDFFASGSDRIAGEGAIDTLNKICGALKNFPRHRIEIAGHTDDVPPKSRFGGNQELSERRAASVERQLAACLRTSRSAFDPNRMTPVGKADREAFKPESGANYRERSRRVEIRLLGGS
jgi:type VI secretion system protein ImpK